MTSVFLSLQYTASSSGVALINEINEHANISALHSAIHIINRVRTVSRQVVMVANSEYRL